MGAFPSAPPQFPRGAAGKVIAEWNGQDLSQFDTETTHPNAPTNNITVQTATPPWTHGYKGPRLELVGANDATMHHLLMKTSETGVLPERYIVEARTGARSGNCIPGIIACWLDNEHFYRVEPSFTASEFFPVAANGNNGTTAFAYYSRNVKANAIATADGNFIRVFVDLENPTASTDPSIRLLVQNEGGDGMDTGHGGAWTSVGGGVGPDGAWDAGWQVNQDIRRAGVSFRDVGVFTTYVSDFRILEWK